MSKTRGSCGQRKHSPVVVDGVMVDVTQDGPSTDQIGQILGVDELAHPIHHLLGRLSLLGVIGAL